MYRVEKIVAKGEIAHHVSKICQLHRRHKVSVCGKGFNEVLREILLTPPYLDQYKLLNLFPHIDAFWRLCSRQLFKNTVTKEEIAQNMQFFPFATMFSTFSHKLSIQLWRFSIFWQNTFKVVCRIAVWGKGLTLYDIKKYASDENIKAKLWKTSINISLMIEKSHSSNRLNNSL